MLTNYFYIHSSFFFYIEYNVFIVYSPLGIIKIKNKSLINSFIKFHTCFSNYFYPYIISFFKNLFLLISHGYSNKFKIIGVGYRQFYLDHIIVYKLRYSHFINKILPLDLLTMRKNKKKLFFTLYGLNKNKVNNIMHMWLSYRITNVYTKKGFIKKNQKLVFKEMIKKLL